MKKRIYSILLGLCMVFSLAQIPALAAESPTTGVSSPAKWSNTAAAFTGNVTGVTTTTPVINAGYRSASFKVTTTHTMSCPIPGMEYLTGTLGPFTNVSNFTMYA